MKLQQLRYFQAACRYGSITAAAQALHVSQPSLSMAIRELEEEFGLKLTQRRYQGFTLTEEGKKLLEMAEELLRHSDQIEQRMEELKQAQPPLRIGVPPMAGSTVLPRLYLEFLPRHTDVRLSTQEVGTKALLRCLLENTLDMAFVTHYHSLPQDFCSVPVMHTETAWCTYPEHPLAGKTSLRIRELENEPLVLFQNSFSVYELVMQRFQDAGLTPNVIHYTGQLSTVYALIHNRAATGFLMRSVEPYFPDMVWVPMEPPFSATISLVWERHKTLSAPMEELINSFRIAE